MNFILGCITRTYQKKSAVAAVKQDLGSEVYEVRACTALGFRI